MTQPPPIPATLDRTNRKAVVSAVELGKQLAMVETPEEARSIEYDAVRLRDMLTLAGKSVEEANKYGSVVLDAAVKIGELLDPNVKRGERTDLTFRRGERSALNPERKTHYRKVARVEAQKLAAYKKEMDEEQELYSKSGLLRFAKGQAANYSSESSEWYTPPAYLRAVREVLGEIDLDPASNEIANDNVQAKKIYTETDDGLSKAWRGRVFVNPPYGTEEGKSVAGKFCEKAILEYTQERATEVIVLVNSLHSQKWQAALYAFPICFVNHRIKFVAGDGSENENPTFQNIFIYLGPNSRRFAEVFQDIGYVMEPINDDR